MPKTEYLNMRSAAEYLGISRARVHDLASAGRIGERIGGYWLFTKAELDKYNEERSLRPQGGTLPGEVRRQPKAETPRQRIKRVHEATHEERIHELATKGGTFSRLRGSPIERRERSKAASAKRKQTMERLAKTRQEVAAQQEADRVQQHIPEALQEEPQALEHGR